MGIARETVEEFKKKASQKLKTEIIWEKCVETECHIQKISLKKSNDLRSVCTSSKFIWHTTKLKTKKKQKQNNNQNDNE